MTTTPRTLITSTDPPKLGANGRSANPGTKNTVIHRANQTAPGFTNSNAASPHAGLTARRTQLSPNSRRHDPRAEGNLIPRDANKIRTAYSARTKKATPESSEKSWEEGRTPPPPRGGDVVVVERAPPFDREATSSSPSVFGAGRRSTTASARSTTTAAGRRRWTDALEAVEKGRSAAVVVATEAAAAAAMRNRRPVRAIVLSR
mmetsp:Transcript_1664/g.3576  ORF Transcript_1664/g.3576 Transcript_1664/m.3576 type:complete len:204 (+) Transcript_1664:946-1557(+)